jgi:PadR family transcriptional regulator, regulatory protein PadR
LTPILFETMYCSLNCTWRHIVTVDESIKLDLELRRGALALAVLSQLGSPQYGYSLRQALAARGMGIEEGTLYPLLRRLEAQGLLESEWRIEDGPPRRYYRLSEAGGRALRQLAEHWREMVRTMDGLLEGKV